MKCEDYQQLISLYLDDALSYDEKLQLEVHLKDCPTCQETFEMMHMMIKGLEDLEDVPLPEGFHASVHKALLKEQSRVEMEQLQIKEPCVQDIKRTVVKEKKSKKSVYRWLTYASGLAAAVVIGFVLVPSGQDPQIGATQVSPLASAPEQSKSRAQAESYAL
ncbi:MAG: zf-HC2 domain-containing protein, partial [Niameybacter sp.]